MKIKNRVVHSAMYILLSVYSIISLYPLVWMLFNSFKNNDEIFSTNPLGIPKIWRVDNYIRAWNTFNIPLYLVNSIIVTVCTAVLTIIIGVMFSYATARMKWRLSNAARIYISVGMFIPVQVILIPTVMLMKNAHLSGSYFTLIIPYVAFQLGFASIVFYGFFRSIPYSLEEAAAIDGANIYTTFFKIILPLVKPAISTMILFISLNIWNEFPVALVMVNKEALKTLPLGLIGFKGQFGSDFGGMGAALVIASIPTILLYLLFADEVEKALTVGSAVKG